MALNLRNKFIFIELLINNEFEYPKHIVNQDFNFDNEEEYRVEFNCTARPSVRYTLIWRTNGSRIDFIGSGELIQRMDLIDCRGTLESFFAKEIEWARNNEQNRTNVRLRREAVLSTWDPYAKKKENWQKCIQIFYMPYNTYVRITCELELTKLKRKPVEKELKNAKWSKEKKELASKIYISAEGKPLTEVYEDFVEAYKLKYTNDRVPIPTFSSFRKVLISTGDVIVKHHKKK